MVVHISAVNRSPPPKPVLKPPSIKPPIRPPVATGVKRAVSIAKPTPISHAQVYGKLPTAHSNAQVTPNMPVKLGAAAASIGTQAISHFTGVNLGAVASAATGGGMSTGGGSTVLSVGRHYILRQTASGRIVATPRVPRRRFRSRGGGKSKMDKLLEFAVISNLMKH